MALITGTGTLTGTADDDQIFTSANSFFSEVRGNGGNDLIVGGGGAP